MNIATSSTSGRRRVLIIGLDGGTLDVIHPLVEAGRLPHLGRLMRTGCWGPLRSTVPPLTAPAWTSFMTGVNPGRHGLFDFRYRAADSYELFTNNTTTMRAPMLWEVLSRRGKQCCVLNVPATYPPRPLHGALVTGLLTPADAEVFTYPVGLSAEIRAAFPGYEVWPAEVRYPKGRELAFLESTRRLTETSLRLFQYMQPRGDWDFQMLVFMSTDQVQHATWHYRDASHRDHPAHPPAELRDAIDSTYAQVDAAIGEVLRAVGDETTVLVMSDHGFGPWEQWFHLNAWLLREGFLVVKPAALHRFKLALFRLGITPYNMLKLLTGLGLGGTVARTTRKRRGWSFDMLRRFFLSLDDIDWSRTTAYSLGNIGPLYLNRAGREPQGIVTQAEAGPLLERIAGRLRALQDPCDGGPLVEEPLLGRDAYAGEFAGRGPDMLVFPRNWRTIAFGTTQFTSQRLFTPAYGMTGGHRMDGVFIAAGPGVRPAGPVQGTRLWDIYPTTLALMGLPIPAGLDGRALESVLTPQVLAGVTFDERPYSDYMQAVGGAGYSDEEEALVAERLRGLGYV